MKKSSILQIGFLNQYLGEDNVNLFFINVFEDLGVNIKESAKNEIILLKKTILTNCHFKYEKDLTKIYDNEEECEAKSSEYQTELSNFLRIFND